MGRGSEKRGKQAGQPSCPGEWTECLEAVPVGGRHWDPAKMLPAMGCS